VAAAEAARYDCEQQLQATRSQVAQLEEDVSNLQVVRNVVGISCCLLFCSFSLLLLVGSQPRLLFDQLVSPGSSRLVSSRLGSWTQELESAKTEATQAQAERDEARAAARLTEEQKKEIAGELEVMTSKVVAAGAFCVLSNGRQFGARWGVAS